MMSDIVERFIKVKEKVAKACIKANKKPEQVTIIAVSKTWPAQHIEPLLEYGHRDFGENRIQEAESKWKELKNKYNNTKLHLLGPIQSNKVRKAVKIFDVIHTLDREIIARKIKNIIREEKKSIEIFVQVNTGEEKQKTGVDPQCVQQIVQQWQKNFLLQITGLMCIPPLEENSKLHFATLARFAAELNIAKISMGMSKDFQTAIEQGATHVRIGSEIFGKRN